MQWRAQDFTEEGGGAAHINFEEEGLGKTDIISYKINQKTIYIYITLNIIIKSGA